MHLALDILFEAPENFEKVKNIVKELIFSGASRDVVNGEGQKAIDLAREMEDLLDEDDYKKILYILTPPSGIKFLRMTRPIEKVERDSGCQQISMCLNLFSVIVFTIAGIFDYIQHKQNQRAIILIAVACGFFSITLIFYALTILLDPGYVQKQPNFLRLLKRLIAENYHLDYVCVPCETLRPEEADHCNFCNRCVQKFDHHCVFVNNCLGYRNHLWFLLFLVSFTGYMITVVAHSTLLISRYVKYPLAYATLPGYQIALNWVV